MYATLDSASLDLGPLAACPAHRPVRSPLARGLLLALGVSMFALGALGLVLPLLPTLAFWLVAAWSLVRARPALATPLLEHRRFGPTLRDFLCYGVVRRPAKRIAIGGMTASLAGSVLVLEPSFALAALVATWATASVWFASRPEG
ncbi:YbaN family protein [Plasticicumulans acidivorans]|uniref:DUF454 domain-containing protein n=1 Tax=Plasticicumulans acidivorans TaxID=886464 RepID=A0A317MVB4_9GAMM|nr:YbaN family protein [Plasticicumulans acidivorans]PWV62211.1 hypothetical protein C7443_1045 [Plasticicumulans acidivorans]